MGKEYNPLNDYQQRGNKKYYVEDLIAATKSQECEVIKVKVADMFLDYAAPNENDIPSFIEHMKRTLNADLSYPIILGPDNFVMDGKHRLAKAVFLGEKKIKAYRLKELPEGYKIED